MAEEEERTNRYEVVWNRVKVYIPFLQDLISFYKNDSHQNRQQQLQKIITIYDLLTNQRLNYQSLCKCEKVLIKLHETNPLKKAGESTTSPDSESTTQKQNDGDTPTSPGDPDTGSDVLFERGTPVQSDNPIRQDYPAELDTSAKSDSPVVPDTPAEPDIPAELESPAEPDTPTEPDIRYQVSNSDSILEPLSPDTDNDELWDDPQPMRSKSIASKPPLSLDEIKRLITNKSEPVGAKNRSNNNLSKIINDTLKVFQKPSFDENARNPSLPYEDSHHVRSRNVPYSPTYPSQISMSQSQSFPGAHWEAENDAFGNFPHPVNSSFRNYPSRNSNNIDLTPRPQSPPLYRRRDDLQRFHDDRMDISPTYSSPSDNRTGAVSAVNMKDPRVRKAVESSMHVHSPESLGPDRTNPFFPTVKANDPRLNRSNIIPMPPAPTPNELPKCVAPNPNLPLDFPKKDPPKRRLSICVNQVIIEEIPPEPVMLPPRSFPDRRQSICGDFNVIRNNEPFHGTSFLPVPSQTASASPMMPHPSLVTSHPSQPMPPPSQPIPVMVNHSIEAPSVAERDPRRKNLPPGAEYMQPHHHNQHPANRFERPTLGPSKAPLTYLEYRRQKEMSEKHRRDQNKLHNRDPERRKVDKNNSEKDHKQKDEREKKQTEETDLTIGMVPNKSRVAAKAYAKPAKSFTPKDRRFAPTMKEKPRTDSKFSPKSHKSDSPSTSQKTDRKRDEPEKDKTKSVQKTKDLFGEQLSQFDKMYRSGDFSKKASPAAGIGGFKIPKIKRVEKPSEPIVKPTEGQQMNQRKEKSKSKSPEPPKSMDDDDDMWDSESVEKPIDVKQQKKESPKNMTSLKSLEDDDLWDTDPSFTKGESDHAAPVIEATISATAGTSASKEIAEEDDKPKQTTVETLKYVFQVPSLPAPRRILRRRNSVAVQNNETEARTISNIQAFTVPSRITRRRNSIAVSQLEDDGRNAEKVEKELPPSKKEAMAETETEDDVVIRPRRTCKRKAIIEDDDEDGCSANADAQPKEKETSKAETDDSKAQETAEATVVPVKEDVRDNVVSSTTGDTTSKKPKRGRKKKASVVTPIEGNVSSDTSHDQSTDLELPVEASSSAENNTVKEEKPVDIKEDQLSEAAKEAKEERENKEIVEGLLRGSTNPDNKTQLLAMLSTMCDEKKLKKIQEIMDSPSDKSIANESEEKPAVTTVTENPENVVYGNRERTVSTSISSTNEVGEKEKAAAKGRKSELDKLNEDIAEMYIRDGVLSATGRRSCTKRYDVRAPPLKLVGARKPSSAPVINVEVVKELKKGMEIELTEKIRLKRLRVLVQKVDLSKVESSANSKTTAAKSTIMDEKEDDIASTASNGTVVSPKSKKKKRSAWASGTVPKRKKKAETKQATLSPQKICSPKPMAKKKVETKQASLSPQKIYTPKPVTKNVNRELHCKSDKAKHCALCSYVGPLTGIVQHYVRNHPLHEVYVSRILNSVAVKLKKEPMAVTGTMDDQNITFQCIFCQEVLSKKKYNWKLHLASHTGEYRYKCNNCTIKSLAPSTNAHDSECVGPAMDVMNDVMFNENHIYGYMCRLCNFVQLSRPKVDAHVKEEHERSFSGRGILRFSILNFEEPVEQTSSKDTLKSDISMPALTPQVPMPSQTNMSAFISSATDEIESLKVLNDRNFVSPSKPSIIDKLKNNFDEIMRKDAAKGTGDDEEWEDIDSPPKKTNPQKVTPKRVEKVKRSLAGSASPSEDIPMPTPLALKKENVDIFEHKQVVANIGYSRSNETIWYLCLIGDCKFTTQARSEMYSHVEQQHGSIVWDGYCYLCTAQVLNEDTSALAKEIKHMAVIHIKDRTAFDELSEPSLASPSSALIDDRPMLKLRRFSGDKLSLGTTEELINLKPWLETPTAKNRAHCLNMLEQKSLFCFYKCMGTSCCFTSTIEAQMEKHIDNHELVGDIAGAGSPKSWLECAYCDVVAEGKIDLLHHLRLVHTGSAFQCAYCFYRSREAYNVVLHQKLHHAKDNPVVLVNELDKRPLTPADYERLNRRPIDNILPLICTVCNAEYCVLDAFMSHLKDDHAKVTTIVCQCCKENIQKLKIPRHLLQHNIGIYECIYCQFGSNTMEAVQTHVCNRHPQEPLYCCIRYNKTPGKVKEASLKSLYEMSVDENVLVYCNFKPEELNYKSPDTKSNHDINFIAKPGVIPLQLPPIRIGDTNIFLSAQIPSSSSSSTTETSNKSVVVTAKTAAVIKMPMISSVSGGVSLPGTSTVPIITAVQGNYQGPTPTGPSKSIVMPVISQVIGGANISKMPIITRVEGGVADVARLKPASSLVGTKIIISPNKGSGVPIITNVCSIGPSNNQVQPPKEDEATMLEAERIAMEMIKDTGLPKNVIYKCVFKGCNSVLPDGTGMRKHLTFSHLPAAQYVCSHCKGKSSFQNVMSFTQHLKTHEAQRIFCFMCDYKGSFPPEVIKHVKDVHKTSKPTILFLNPKKNDPNNDIILFAPGIPTEAERKAYYRKLIDLYNFKLQAALIHLKTHFAPEECESLPKQAIFSQTVFCSKCQYSTKVKLNMYRHLKGHLNDMPVSNMDPKNPVPCWGQGEKHFDRMRNPAASSQEDDDLIQSLCFVQENKRYICGAPDCRYLTINEGMLRNHLSTLHADVKEYKCPHCPAVNIFSGQLNVGKVLEHLKLHDKELYRCSKCSIFMNKKDAIDQHVDDKHSSQTAAVYVIRDGSTAGSGLSVGTAEDGIVFKWKCDVCKFKSPTLGEMRLHMQETHNITVKYRCSRCLYSCSNKSLFTIHFEKQHPGCEIAIISLYKAIDGDDSRADTTPLWRRETCKTRSIRGILLEEEDENEDEPNPSDMAGMAAEPQPGPSGFNFSRKRRSTENDESEISPKRSKEENSAVRAFKCGFKGCNYVNDFGAGIVSHFRSAHPKEKPSVLRNSLANPEQSRFDYFMKYACFYCVKKADTIQDLVAHWRQMHKLAGRRSQDKPFLFRTSKIILCLYCRKGAVMPEMKSHFTTYHPGHQAIYLDFRNPKRCAECDFSMGADKQEMVQHFTTEHRTENEYANGWIDFLTDDIVDKILQLNSVVYRCEQCDFSTDNKTDFTIHYATKHPGLRVEFNEYEMEKTITYYCAFSNCQSSWNSPQALAQHIQYHIPLFKCLCDTVQCSAQFRSFVMLLEHFNTTHPQQELQYCLKSPDEYKAVLRSINIHFWNGFVMTLDDARRAGNRYGSYDFFFKYIDELCAKSVAAAIPTPSLLG